MNRIHLIFAGMFVLLVAVVAVVFFRVAAKKPRVVVDYQELDLKTVEPSTQGVIAVSIATNQTAATVATRVDDEAAREAIAVAEREKKLEVWQAAMDSNDEELILAESVKIMKNSDPEIRLSAVEGLTWIGAKGLIALTEMMYDRDPEVAKAAAEAWLDGVEEMDEELAAELLNLVTDTLDRLDEDTVIEILHQYENMEELRAANPLYNILKNTQNPEYLEYLYETINFVIQPETPVDNKDDAMKALEDWMREHKDDVLQIQIEVEDPQVIEKEADE